MGSGARKETEPAAGGERRSHESGSLPDAQGLRIGAVVLAIALASFAVYGQILDHAFVDYDDYIYFIDDPDLNGRIEIAEDHSLVDLPEGMPKVVQKVLAKAWVCGQRLQIRPVESADAAPVTPYKPKFDGTSRPQHKAAGKPDLTPGAKKFVKKPGPPRS